MVSVFPPPAGIDMYFNTSTGQPAIGTNNGIHEICPPVAVDHPGINDLDRTTVFGGQVGPAGELLLSDFHDRFLWKIHAGIFLPSGAGKALPELLTAVEDGQ
jgi:hypothetical protein